jgi:hypothetical protein
VTERSFVPLSANEDVDNGIKTTNLIINLKEKLNYKGVKI